MCYNNILVSGKGKTFFFFCDAASSFCASCWVRFLVNLFLFFFQKRVHISPFLSLLMCVSKFLYTKHPCNSGTSGEESLKSMRLKFSFPNLTTLLLTHYFFVSLLLSPFQEKNFFYQSSINGF